MNEAKICKVAIYARVSTEEQAERGYSIDAQLDQLRQYCQLHRKIVFDEYVDPGVSGKEMKKRRELLRLLKDADEKKFDEVIVWKINRLSRKTKDLLDIVERLNQNNVYFRSFSENFETETPMGKFALQMMGAVGELERNTIVENVRLGMKQRARMGYHNGGICLGYEKHVDEAGRKTIKVVEQEAVIVRKIFTLYASGKGLRAIANQLNREGHRTKKNNTFSTDSIREIITNPVYAGTVRYNRYEGWSEKRRRGKNSNPILAEGRHEAIIDQETWDRVQSLFRKKSKANPRVYDGVSLLTGLIRCPHCGTPMVASRTVSYLKDGTKVVRRYYSCGKFKSQGSSVCSAHSVGAENAERYVLERIQELVTRPKVLQAIVNSANKKRMGNIGPLKEEFQVICRNLEQLSARKRRVMELYEIDEVDRDELNDRVNELTAEENKLHERKVEIDNILRNESGTPLLIEHVRSVLSMFDRLLAGCQPEQQKLLLRLAVKDITVGSNRGIDQIELFLDEETQNHFIASDPSASSAEGSLCVNEGLAPIRLFL